MTIGIRLAALLGAIAVAAPAYGAAPAGGPAKIGRTKAGRQVLQTPAGMTLYVYDKDPVGRGQSNCTNTCAKSWPPFTPKSLATARRTSNAEWKLIARDDGSKQWSYKGRPLYTFYRDEAPGESRGKDFEGHQWRVAQP